ncbi:MAG: hypothetical protein ACYCO0_03045 [Candidatus Micrarchaeaceae archaeon]
MAEQDSNEVHKPEEHEHAHNLHTHEAHPQHSHEVHPDAAHAQKAAPNNTNIIIGAMAIVIVILAAALILTLSTRPAASAASQPGSSISSTPGSSQNATAPAASQVNPYAPASPAAAKMLMNKSEAVSLLGPNGAFNASMIIPSELNISLQSQGLQNYSISGEYLMTYNTVGRNNTDAIQEVAFPTPLSKRAYSGILSHYAAYFNATFMATRGSFNLNDKRNVTAYGLNYSYSSFSLKIANSTSTATGTIFIGFNNHTVVIVQVSRLNSTEAINATKVASIVAGNIK